MKCVTGPNRRAFVRGGASLLALIAGGFPACLGGPGARSDGRRGAGNLLEDLRDAMPRTGDARRLGFACLGTVPWLAEALTRTDGGKLGARDIEGRLRSALGGSVRPLQRGELRSRIAARTREDFRSGRTVCVEGWILARTEALIYAVLVVA